jgi:hypothetical protein
MNRTEGWAMLSVRPSFVQQVRSMLRIRHLLIQDTRDNPLPAARAPLLLDTIGMQPLQLLSLLVAIRQARIATAAIVAANDYFVQRMLLLCPPVRLIMTEQADLGSIIPPLTRVLPTMSFAHEPICLQIAALPELESAISPSMPDILLSSLQGYKHNVTARKCGMSRATLYRILAETKTALKVSVSTPKTPPDILAQRLIAAFQVSHPPVSETPSRFTALDKLILMPRPVKPPRQFRQQSFFETMTAA